MATIRETEKRLAVMTNWAMFAPFGLCLILSGSAGGQWLVSLGGFAAFVLGFIAHVIINAIYRTTFSQGEIVVGFIGFGVTVLCFIVSWLTTPTLAAGDVIAGIAGFAALIACFVVYLITKFGLKGAFSKFHIKGGRRLES